MCSPGQEARNTNPYDCRCRKKRRSCKFNFLVGKKMRFDGEYQIFSDLEAGLYLCVKIHSSNFGVQRIVLSPKAQGFAAPMWDLGLGVSFVLEGALRSLPRGWLTHRSVPPNFTCKLCSLVVIWFSKAGPVVSFPRWAGVNQEQSLKLCWIFESFMDNAINRATEYN